MSKVAVRGKAVMKNRDLNDHRHIAFKLVF
jgi:hypothetical protein